MKPTMMKGLLGLILCGGQSRRMGRDKGLLLQEGMPWARYMGSKLLGLEVRVVYSIHAGQQAAYAAAMGDVELVVDSPGLERIEGPMRGLLTVHEAHPGNDILMLACDMLDLDEGTIGRLADMYQADGGAHDFYVYAEKGFAQPFCGIYTKEGLAGPHLAALEGRLTDYSLQSMLRGGRTWRGEIEREEAFRNYNTL